MPMLMADLKVQRKQELEADLTIREISIPGKGGFDIVIAYQIGPKS
jgi:hypothetical protein